MRIRIRRRLEKDLVPRPYLLAADTLAGIRAMCRLAWCGQSGCRRIHRRWWRFGLRGHPGADKIAIISIGGHNARHGLAERPT
jgi:hypothetical protein